MDIEGYAVAQVIANIAQTDRIIANLALRDKIPIWDGDIFVYSDSTDHSNEHLLRKIPAQVKGNVGKINSKRINYSIKVCDLVHYKNTGGAIFFLVRIDKKNNKIDSRIYYAKLLPFSIMMQLNQHYGQKTISFEFREFPTAENHIIGFFNRFCNDAKKQLSIANKEELPTLKNLQEAGVNVNRQEFQLLPNDGEHMFSQFFEDSTYTYVTDHIGNKYPIQEIPPSSEVKQTLYVDIYCNEKKYYNHYDQLITPSETQEFYGRSIKISGSHSDKKRTLTFTPAGTFSDIILDAEFIINVTQTSRLKIGQAERNITFHDPEWDKKNQLETFKKQLEDCLHALTSIGASDIDINNLSEEDWQKINILVNAFVYKRPVKLSVDFNAFTHIFEIANQKILVFATATANAGMYMLHNFTKTNLKPFIAEESGNKRISQFSLLDKDDWKNITNIDYAAVFDIIIDDIGISEEYDDEINILLLTMLTAYDECKIPNKQLLDLIIKIAEYWQKRDMGTSSTKCVYQLNYLQSIKRKRDLTIEENQFLTNILKDDEINIVLKVGANILLEDFSRAARLFNSLDDKQKTSIMNFPIANLWKHNCPMHESQ